MIRLHHMTGSQPMKTGGVATADPFLQVSDQERFFNNTRHYTYMNRNRFNFPIPFDPFRLLLASIEKLWLWLLAGLIFALAGVVAAVVILGDSYTAPVKIAKESAPLYWSLEQDAPYRPRPLTGEALELIAQSPAVYERTGQMMGGLTLEDVESLVTFQSGSGEDIYEVTGYSKESDEASLKLAATYAQAIIDIASEKRREEALAAATLFRTQLKHRQDAMTEAGDALRARSSEQHGILTGENIGGHFNEVQALRAKRADTRVALLTKKENLGVYLSQAVLTPLQQEIALLRASRTDQHPAVRRKQQEIDQIDKQLQAVASGKVQLESLSNMVPASLYAQAKALMDEIKTLETSLAEYERMMGQADAETASLSEQAINTANIRSSFDLEVSNAATIESRLKDAEFFASVESGGPVELFSAPHVANVKEKSRWFKAGLLGGFGLVFGAGVALAFIFLKEVLSKKLRTPMQAAIASATLPKFMFHSGKGFTANLHDFAVTCILKFLPERRFLFPVVGDVDGESEFWKCLLESFGRGGSKQRVVFADVSHQPVMIQPNGQSLPDYDPSATDQTMSRIDIAKLTGENFANFASSLPTSTILLVRWASDPDATLAALAPHIERYYLVASQVSSNASELEELSRVYDQVLGDAEGLVLVQKERPGFASRFVSAIERWFIQMQAQRSSEPSTLSGVSGAPLRAESAHSKPVFGKA
ncbi:MAG: hypothetical protein R3F19_14785 [Verrucomicrobiales bacterium]